MNELRGASLDPLDNVVWHALRGPLQAFAAPDARGDFVRFEADVGLFGAVEQLDAMAWKRIAETVGPGSFCLLVRDDLGTVPGHWQVPHREPLLQMVVQEIDDPTDRGWVDLDAADTPDMLALAHATNAAPLLARTPELGRYVGIREHGQLIAMAGQRLRVPGFVEISAVCTDPEFRSRGLASDLVREQVRAIRDGGNEAFLHVEETNANAAALYEKLGFSVRHRMEVAFVQRPPDVPHPESEQR